MFRLASTTNEYQIWFRVFTVKFDVKAQQTAMKNADVSFIERSESYTLI